MGAVMLTDSRHVYFHALDEAQTRGIYRIDVGTDGSRSPVQQLVREGDVLPDGTVVKDFSDGDVNNGDDFVVAVENPEGTYSLQYGDSGGAFRSLAKSGQTLGSVQLAEDIDQYQSVSDDGNIMFVAEFLNDAGDCQGEGLFVMPAGRPEETRRLLAKGDLLPGSNNAVIETFGVAEITTGGAYTVQGTGRPASGPDPGGRPLTFLLRGVVGETPQLLVADSALASRSPSNPIRTGQVFMCPRLGALGVGHIVQFGDEFTDLEITRPGRNANNTVQVARARANGYQTTPNRTNLSPRGAGILTFMPPVFGPNGLVYYEVFTDQGMEIVVWNPQTLSASTVLARGDVVDGKKVETIIFGALPDCVNANGDFAAIVEFDDGETDVYLGLPV
jgi:hypothetical protein